MKPKVFEVSTSTQTIHLVPLADYRRARHWTFMWVGVSAGQAVLTVAGWRWL